jgi:hypothetical protein
LCCLVVDFYICLIHCYENVKIKINFYLNKNKKFKTMWRNEGTLLETCHRTRLASDNLFCEWNGKEKQRGIKIKLLKYYFFCFCHFVVTGAGHAKIKNFWFLHLEKMKRINAKLMWVNKGDVLWVTFSFSNQIAFTLSLSLLERWYLIFMASLLGQDRQDRDNGLMNRIYRPKWGELYNDNY